jgi:hypothetical protein
MMRSRNSDGLPGLRFFFDNVANSLADAFANLT